MTTAAATGATAPLEELVDATLNSWRSPTSNPRTTR